MAALKKQSYSDSLLELEKILKQLENEDISLEELSPLVKKATALIQKCREQLFETDAEIQQILATLE